MPPEDEADMVPKKRLDQEIDKRRQAAARVGELEQEARDLRASVERLQPLADNHETLVTEIGSLKEQLQGLEAARTEDRAIFSRHFDDPDLVRFEHSRVEDAPPLGEWLEGLTEETAPPSLRSFLGQQGASGEEEGGEQGAGAEQEQAPKKKGGGTTSKGSGGSRAPAGTPAKMTPDRAQQIRARAKETGDWSEWRAYRGGGSS